MQNTVLLLMLTGSVGVNIYLMVIVIPKINKFGPAYILEYMAALLLHLKRVKYKIPGFTIEGAINSIENTINKIEDEQSNN